MNPFQKLLQSISGSGIQRAAGLIDNLGTPIRKSLEDMPANLSILRDLVTRGRPTSVVDNLGAPIEKVVRKIDDVVIRGRPVSKVAQRIINEDFPGDFSSYIRHGSTPGVYDQSGFKYISTLNPTQKFLQEYGNKLSSGVANTAASLKPTSAPTAFPFDDPLTLLKGQARYAQRQIQGGIGQGIGQVGNLYKKLQGVGPTAVNPFATSTPTTLLGKAGKVINPLNPINAAGFATAGLINQFVPEDGPLKGNLELLAGIPGGPLAKLFGTGMLAATPLGMSDKQETALSQIGKNYIVNGIQYDYKTGRPVNPRYRQSSDRSAAPPDDSGFIEIDNNTNNRRPENFSSPRNTEAERRSYLSELSSVAQQTAQNPLLNQYNALRKPDPRAAEDLGMQMFALANPELAKKVRPGQAGYDVMQRVYPQATTAATLPTSVGPPELTEEEIAIANQMFYNQY